jgi:TRAP-type C4-dicarboxylate transport system permease small subunit
MTVTTTKRAAHPHARHPYDVIIRLLDPLYRLSGYAAGFCIFAIFVVTMVQIIGRLVGYNPAGLVSYASYLMAASVFCGLAHTFDAGGQIRIELFLSMMGRVRWLVERIGFVFAAAIAGWMSYHAWSMVYWSVKLGDISEGMDATPLWIPQSTMAVGVTLFFVAVLDRTIRLALLGSHGLDPAPDAL